VWVGCGRSFQECLELNHLCDPHKYAKFCKAVSQFTLEKVRSIGFDAAVNAIKIPIEAKSAKDSKKSAQRTYVDEAAAIQAKFGTPLPAKEARLLLKKHVVKVKTYKVPSASPKETLEKQVLRLKKENAALKAENDKLKEELALLKSSNKKRSTRASNVVAMG